MPRYSLGTNSKVLSQNEKSAKRTSEEPLAKPAMKCMSATTIRDDKFLDATMNAVIFYDKFDFAAKAKAILERAAHRTDETTHWSVKPWRVDMLKLPPAAEAALAKRRKRT